MITTFDKAIAAFLGALLSILVLLHVPVPTFLEDPTLQATIGALIAGILTYFVPNKPASS